MAPHDALLIPEILMEILEKLRKSDYGYYPRHNSARDLLSTALCCKAFKDLSLDVLWDTIENITPVLMFIPGMQDINGQMSLHHSGELDLQKFYAYANRVRHIIAHNAFAYSIPSLEPQTCVRLSGLENGLFPHLKSLSLTADSFSGAVNPSFLPFLLLSKSLSEVTYIAEPYGELSDILAIIVKHTNIHNLRHLELQGALDHRYVSTLSQFSQLQSVILSLGKESWTPDIFVILSHLQLLDLHLDFFSEGLSIGLENPAAKIPFPTLQKLTLVGALAGALNALNFIAGNRIQYIRICTYWWKERTLRTGRADHERLYQFLARFPSLQGISHVITDPGYESEAFEFIDEPINLSRCIQPIMSLKHLESLKLGFQKPCFYVSDDDISRLALACPSLKVLNLRPVPEKWLLGFIRPTFASLRCLATTCLDLVELELSISIDEQSLPPDTSIVSSHGLKSLCLHDTRVDRSLLFRLSRLLDQLFPNLKFVRHGGDEQVPRIRDLIFDVCQPVRTARLSSDGVPS